MLKRFSEAVQGASFAIAAELTLRRDSTASDVLHQAQALRPCVDGVQVTDNPYGWVQMSALSASAILIEHGVDPVPVLSCRDRNRDALAGELVGLHALGVSSLMLMRGHRVPKSHSMPAPSVFDLTGLELISLAADLNRHFFIGTGARVFRPGPQWRADSLSTRSAAGAAWVQTQLCFNTDILRRYMERFVAAEATHNVPVMVTLSPLPSVATARWVKRNMSDSRIPDALLKRLEDANDPEQEGLAICAELMQEISEIPGVSGVNLMTTGDPGAIPETIRASGLRSEE